VTSFDLIPSSFANITPQIDGAITSGYTYEGTEVPGEWDDAFRIDFQLDIIRREAKDRTQPEAHNATLYLKNDMSNIYAALVVWNEEYSPGDAVLFSFDNTNNAVADVGDDQLLLFGDSNIFVDSSWSGDRSTADAEQNGVGSARFYSPLILVEPIYTLQAVRFVQEIDNPLTLIPSNKASQVLSKPAQGIQPIPISSIQPPITITPVLPAEIRPKEPGIWVFEVAHPLNSADDAHDISAQVGDTIGISVAYWDGEQAGVGAYPAFLNWAEMLRYKIAGPLGSPVLAQADLSVDWIEVTQAIQDTSNSLPLAQKKKTVAQVYLDIGAIPGPVTVNVFLYTKDSDTLSSLPGPLVAAVNAPSNPQRTNITHSANFLLPNSWVMRPHLELTAYITSSTHESNYDNNWVPWQQFTFKKLRPLNVYEIKFNTGTVDSPNTVSDAFITAQEEVMRSVYPMEINFIRLNWAMLGETYSGSFWDIYGQLIADLNALVGQLTLAWWMEYIVTDEEPSWPLPDLLYGYYTSGGGVSNPIRSGGYGIVATGYWGTSRELTMAHEFDHNLDHSESGTWGRHTGPDNYTNCGAGGWDSEWPYNNPNINEIGLDTSVWPPKVISTTWPDFMSYCQSGTYPTKWISPYRWENLVASAEFVRIVDSSTGTIAKNARGNDQSDLGYSHQGITIQPIRVTKQVLQVLGWLEQEPKGNIESIFQLEAPDATQRRELIQRYPHLTEIVGESTRLSKRTTPLEHGFMQYELVAIGPDESELYSKPFLTSFISEEGDELSRVYFTKYIPMNERLQKGGRIELRVEGKTLVSQTISPGVPEVQLLTPTGREQWRSGEKVTISWKATDPDDDQLLFIVQYSPNGGKVWLPLTSGLKDTSLVVDPAKIPGSTNEGAYVRVLVSDGFNTVVSLDNGPFAVPGKPPKVITDSPVSGQTFGFGDIIPLKGYGFDLEDGRIPESAFEWSFEGGILGNGSAIDVVRLGPGDHMITLTATDSDGMKGMAQIKIHVSHERIAPVFKAEPHIRAGAGLRLSPTLTPTMIVPGESVVLQVIVQNAGVEPANAVELIVRLPPELSIASGSNSINWKIIEPGKSVEAEFEVLGKEQGVYPIEIQLETKNLRPTVAAVHLGVGKKLPLNLQLVVTKPPETTTPVETKPMETITTRSVTSESPPEISTPSKPIPGFETVPVLLALPFLLWFCKRRRRR